MRSIDQLTKELLSLPNESRALLADRLLESLEFDTDSAIESIKINVGINMVESNLYTTAKVLPGNIIEIQSPDLTVGQTVDVIILAQEVSLPSSSTESIYPSLKQRLAFLKLPMAERRNILKNQAEIMLSHYQKDSEWQELMAGDIIDY